ncbi:MAG: tRNA (adenosine(37)-N6)-threonylcarbamoyltransferase complex transferase subunit TsaD [Candidatus Marinimicrobia bacterium]|nr:tRNA (adenosine(37)-N6)-threonylcarbamoyltransferase complex transferase subunit TsaD [Candidatus Neomarinimicrobiota bacterium]
MNIIGIESSCDETAVSIINDEQVLVSLISSQELHKEYGGVVPEFASREHMKNIDSLVAKAFDESGLTINDINGIAVTRGPGLMGALLVGLSYAKGLSFATQIPLIGVNHIEGHIIANFLNHPNLEYPFLCCLVSGGHTQIVHVKDFQNYEIMGKSIDDAAGEAFDKAARILGLGYPGGPIIDALAKSGNPKFFRFPRAQIKNRPNDFSFSGLKTSVLYLTKQEKPEWIKNNIHHICASYQEAIIDSLQKKTFKIQEEIQARRIVLAGGVAANSRLREIFQKKAAGRKVEIYFPSLAYCTDNAAMIAKTGMEMLKRNRTSSLDIKAIPNLRLID